MDADRFDSLTATLATAPTRRGTLRFLAALVAGLAPLVGGAARPADAKKRRRRRRKRKPNHKRHRKPKPRPCPAQTKRCNGKCIDQDGCCTSDECGDGGVCDEQHACACAPQYKSCGDTCIPASECCDGCPKGSTCQEGECACAPGYQVCGDGCIPDDECCDGCPKGMTCQDGACVCAPDYKTCEDTCIPASECCGGCPKGMACEASSCVCAPHSKPCGDGCIPEDECCGGCPKGMTCEASICVCAPRYKACGNTCIPESECCEGCPTGMTCQDGACVCAPDYKACEDTCIPASECCGGCPNGTTCEDGECVGNGKPLYPDLRTLPARDLTFDTLSDGTYILRFSNSVWNAGEGRLELEGDPTPQPDPDVAKKVYQNLYDAPIGGTLVSHKQVASDFIYHPNHMHFHFANFASYLLLARDSKGIYQPTTKKGTKTSFCIEDSNPLPGATYPAQYDTCGTDRQGLTPGWADTYGYRLADQWVVLGTEPLSDGEYAVQSIADPKGVLDEGGGKRESNNSSITYFTVQDGAIGNVRDQP
jgi:hypothetical protein